MIYLTEAIGPLPECSAHSCERTGLASHCVTLARGTLPWRAPCCSHPLPAG